MCSRVQLLIKSWKFCVKPPFSELAPKICKHCVQYHLQDCWDIQKQHTFYQSTAGLLLATHETLIV